MPPIALVAHAANGFVRLALSFKFPAELAGFFGGLELGNQNHRPTQHVNFTERQR